MKKLLLLLMLLPLGLYAQVVVNEDSLGRRVIIRPARVLSSSDTFPLKSPEPLFKVFKAEDRFLRKCDVYAEVLECKKSNMSGAEGRLVIRPLYILTKEGEKIWVRGDIHIRGLNRSNVKMALCFVPFMWFVPGTGAITGSDDFTVYLE